MIYHSFFKPDEYFVPLKDFEKEYQISNYACIYDIPLNTLKLDNPLKISKTYRAVVLRKDGGVTQLNVHQLMAKTFLPNPQNHKIVNHKDRNRRNNALPNLEWTSHSGNMSHWHHHEMARCRLIEIGDTVIINRTGEKAIVKGKSGYKWLHFDWPVYFEHIASITDPRSLDPDYEQRVQDGMKIISQEMKAEKERIKRPRKSPKAKFEGNGGK